MRNSFLPSSDESPQLVRVISSPKPISPENWPDYIKEIAAQKIDDEIGVGDTVQRVIAPFGSDKFKCWFDEKTGFKSKPCSCNRDKWNKKYRY